MMSSVGAFVSSFTPSRGAAPAHPSSARCAVRRSVVVSSRNGSNTPGGFGTYPPYGQDASVTPTAMSSSSSPTAASNGFNPTTTAGSASAHSTHSPVESTYSGRVSSSRSRASSLPLQTASAYSDPSPPQPHVSDTTARVEPITSQSSPDPVEDIPTIAGDPEIFQGGADSELFTDPQTQHASRNAPNPIGTFGSGVMSETPGYGHSAPYGASPQTHDDQYYGAPAGVSRASSYPVANDGGYSAYGSRSPYVPSQDMRPSGYAPNSPAYTASDPHYYNGVNNQQAPPGLAGSQYSDRNGQPYSGYSGRSPYVPQDEMRGPGYLASDSVGSQQYYGGNGVDSQHQPVGVPTPGRYPAPGMPEYSDSMASRHHIPQADPRDNGYGYPQGGSLGMGNHANSVDPRYYSTQPQDPRNARHSMVPVRSFEEPPVTAYPPYEDRNLRGQPIAPLKRSTFYASQGRGFGQPQPNASEPSLYGGAGNSSYPQGGRNAPYASAGNSRSRSSPSRMPQGNGSSGSNGSFPASSRDADQTALQKQGPSTPTTRPKPAGFGRVPKSPDDLTDAQKEAIEDAATRFGIRRARPGDRMDERYNTPQALDGSRSLPIKTPSFQGFVDAVGQNNLDNAEKALTISLGLLLSTFLMSGLAISSIAYLKGVAHAPIDGIDEFLSTKVMGVFTPSLVVFFILSSVLGLYKTAQMNAGVMQYYEIDSKEKSDIKKEKARKKSR